MKYIGLKALIWLPPVRATMIVTQIISITNIMNKAVDQFITMGTASPKSGFQMRENSSENARQPRVIKARMRRINIKDAAPGLYPVGVYLSPQTRSIAQTDMITMIESWVIIAAPVIFTGVMVSLMATSIAENDFSQELAKRSLGP